MPSSGKPPRIETPYGPAFGFATEPGDTPPIGWYLAARWTPELGTQQIGPGHGATRQGLESFVRSVGADGAIVIVYNDAEKGMDYRTIMGPMPSLKVLTDIVINDIMEISPP